MDGPPSTPSPVWLPFCTSLAGTAHRNRCTPCQDACAIRRLGASGEIVLLALSDGAGSASHADLGAQTVVSHWLDAFTALLQHCPNPDAVLAESAATTLHTLLANIRNSIEGDAVALEVSPSYFSATLLGAILTPSGALVAQVGDGAWVGCVNGILGCLTWPTGGEFAGQTVFATSESAPHALQIVRLSSPPSALVGFTDGLERLLLDFRTQLPAAGFFRPVLQGLKVSPQTFGAHLEEYLESAAVCERTDDDKSIGMVLNSRADF
jgi:hypothetical protein